MIAAAIFMTLLTGYATPALTYEIDSDRGDFMAELTSRDLNDIVSYHRPISPRVYAPVEKRSSRFCGKYLVDALKMICKGNYNAPGKRAVRSTSVDSPLSNYFESFRSEESTANANIGARVRRGVYDECCLRYCTMKELSSYCWK